MTVGDQVILKEKEDCLLERAVDSAQRGWSVAESPRARKLVPESHVPVTLRLGGSQRGPLVRPQCQSRSRILLCSIPETIEGCETDGRRNRSDTRGLVRSSPPLSWEMESWTSFLEGGKDYGLESAF